ncbi:Cysteine protease atg4b [Mortierella sp. NVP85]|nr:Cysteine protease atg4b [Mortierella sp. NVP85]
MERHLQRYPLQDHMVNMQARQYSRRMQAQCHAQVKIWQVLTKTDLPDYRHSTASSSSKKHGRRHENRFQFERLPIKAPQSSSKTATLSSNGQPFSIVFFFTIESTTPAVSKPKSKSKSSSRSKAAPPPEPTTLWYQETAFTRVRTTHERTELMGTFLPNGASTATEGQQGSPSSPPTSSPLYIYETQKLDIEHPRDDDDTLLLDLKLMGPEGSVYAEFSYTFVRENSHEKSRSKVVDEKHDHSSKSKVKERRSHTMSPMPPRPEKDMSSPRKDRFEHDELDDDYDEAMRMVSNKGSGAEAVAEEPDAGEHFMQATSQFFSKMGYWLYNSKVVQYIARDERIRTKSTFPAEDIWMLGVCYTFIELPLDVKAIEADIYDADDIQHSTIPEAQEPNSEPVSPIDGRPNNGLISPATTPIPMAIAPNDSVSPRTDHSSPDRLKHSNSMPLSRFATSPPQRSAATSFVSCQEAQSHSHSRSPSTSTTSTLMDDTFKHHSASASGGSVQSMSPPGSPESVGSSTIVSEISKLNLNPGHHQPALESKVPAGSSLEAKVEVDSNAQQDTSLSLSNNGGSNSVSALKNLVGSTKGSNTTAGSGGKPWPSSITVEVVSDEISTPTTSAIAIPASNVGKTTTSLESAPGGHPFADENTTHQPNVFSSSPPQGFELATQESAPGVSFTDETNHKRERKRKTSRTLVSSSGSERIEQVHPNDDAPGIPINRGASPVQKLAPSPLSPKSDYIPRTSSPLASPSTPRSISFFPSRRQSTVPLTSSPKTLHNRNDASTPISPLASPPSPTGSSLRRSWRSLSLSLASSAKSALPFGLRSPGAPDQNRHHSVHEATGFGNEYDFNDFDSSSTTSRNSQISLPPSLTAYMSLLRPSPASTVKKLTREQEVLRQFMMDFQSRLWFTYRKDLARIEPSFYTCDSGWGCMMRTGQSLLAQAFVQVLLGREWRAHFPQTQYSRRRYIEILDWFVDDPENPYSIHRIAKAGLALDKRIGEWFGPSTVAHAFQRLSQRHEDCPLSIMVPMDGAVRLSSIMQAATRGAGNLDGSTAIAWKPVLLLIPARFGLDKLTERYVHNLKQLFRMPQFLGIAGGRPGRSLYFVASQGDELFYYDPHFVKPRATPEELGTCPVPSFHCSVVRSQDIIELDPSMLLGFLILSYDDLRDLLTRLGRDMEKSYPLITIQDDLAKMNNDSKRMSRTYAAAAVPTPTPTPVKEDKGSGCSNQVHPSQDHTSQENSGHQESVMAKESHRQVEVPHHDGSEAHIPSQQGGGGPGAKSEQQQHREATPPSSSSDTGFDIDDAFSIKSFDSEDDEEDDDFGGSDEM